MNVIINKIREEFPALSQQMNGKNLIYLDNAATTQKPKSVLSLLEKMSGEINANVHRAMYDLSNKATILYEGAREDVRKFINAPKRENIIFTSGATASINLVAKSFCEKFLKKGDSVLIAADSHHSNIVPWQLAVEKVGGEIKVLPVDSNGELCIEQLNSLIDSKVKIVACSHISNILGIINPIEEIVKIAHDKGVPVLIDGAQGIVHCKVDVQELDCDFYVFSTHKIYGATGSGVLYGKEELLNKMPPYMGGGDMVDTVRFEKTTYAPLPLKFEAGTPNFIGNATLSPALSFLDCVRGNREERLFDNIENKEISKSVKKEEENIKEFVYQALQHDVKDVEIYGNPKNPEKKIPLFSFNIKNCNSSDIAQILDKLGIAIRSGLMCAEPLLNRFGANGALRASFAMYNTLEEAQKFIEALVKAKKMLS